MTPPRTAVFFTLGVAVPVCLWCFAQLAPVLDSGDAVIMVTVQAVVLLVAGQSLLLVFLTPWLLGNSKTADCYTAIMLIIVLPLPLLTVAWAVGAVTVITAICLLISLFALAAICLLIMTMVTRVTLLKPMADALVAVCQVAAVVSLWQFGGFFVAFIGLS